jgi:hypothetical protein
MPPRTEKTIQYLRRALVGDSKDRDRMMKSLLKLVREDERAKVLKTMDPDL